MPHNVATASLIFLLLVATACSPNENTNSAEATGLGANGLKLAGIGDSIMQGFDAGPCGRSICFDQPQYSFAQGTDSRVRSLYDRFESPGLEFVSVSGAEMIDGDVNAKTQAELICAQTVRPNRIVILLGGNDVCHSASVNALPTVENFTKSLNEALSILASSSCGLPRGTAVHVVSVPRVDLLHGAGLAKTDTPCNAIWDDFDICRLVTRSPTKETLAAVAIRINEYNQGILKTISSIQATVDEQRAISFSTDYTDDSSNSSFGTYRFVAEDLSELDCFHPSILGQSKLACMTWESWQGNGAVEDCLD